MAETTFTFKDASGSTKTALAGQNGSSQIAPAAVLYDTSGNVLVGQKTMAASIPVAIASNQSAVPIGDNGGSLTIDGSVSIDNFPATQPISAASLPLPSGAATAANQATANTSLASIDGKIPSSPAAEHTTANSPH